MGTKTKRPRRPAGYYASGQLRLGRRGAITEDSPLTPAEQRFITEYIRTGDGGLAIKASGVRVSSRSGAWSMAERWLARPNIRAEVERVMAELKKDTIATAEEVMTYFTAVMRGKVKDQFGLDAPLMERTKAAQELAKRTIDIENKKKDIPDTSIKVKLDWGR